MGNNVTASKPAVGGALSFAPFGTPLPTSASAALSSAYKKLGYISEDGVVNWDNTEHDSVRAWGQHNVLDLEGAHTDQFKFKLIEAENENVLVFVYGEDNVEVTEATSSDGKKIEVQSTGEGYGYCVLVKDTILQDGAIKRTVIPKAKVVELGDIVYKDKEVTGFDLTVQAYEDGGKATHTDYIEFPL